MTTTDHCHETCAELLARLGPSPSREELHRALRDAYDSGWLQMLREQRVAQSLNAEWAARHPETA